MYYLVPAFIFTGIAFSNFVSNSFGVYLKYQALTDSYYQHRLSQKYSAMLEVSAEEHKTKEILTNSERLLNFSQLPPMGEPSLKPSRALQKST